MLHNVIVALERKGRFLIKEFIGKGGGGELYLAYDNVLKRNVAIKFVVSEDENTKQQLLREARLQAQLSHDNICKIYEVGEIDGVPFIIMQYIKGNSLMYYYDKLNIEQKVKILIKICEALKHAHQSGIVHRDIKPSNILIEEQNGELKPYLIDFGLAKKKDTTTTTATGHIVGSPYFMSPEQASGLVHNIDRRSDIYSLGATLYAFVTGKPPFYNKNSISAIYSIMNEEPELPSKLNPHIPNDIETIILKCMMKEPSLRYFSINEVEEDLKRFLSGEPIGASKPSVFYKIKRKAKKNPLAVSIFLISSFVILVLLGFYINAKIEEKRQTEYIVNFLKKTKEIESFLKTQYLLPFHNIDGARRSILEKIAGVLEVAEPLNEDTRALAYLAIGKCYFYLEEENNALKFLEKGWNYSHDREAALILAMLYFRKYDSLLEKVGGGDKEKGFMKKEMLNYKKKALYYLGFYGINDYLSQGLKEYFDGNYKKAATFFANAMKERYDFYIALIFKGDCYKNLYINNATKDFKYAERFFLKAKESYDEAMKIARSDPQCYVSIANLYNTKMDILIYQSDINLKDIFERSITYNKKAILISSMYRKAYESMIFAYWRYTEFLAYYYPNKSEKIKEFLDKGVKLCSTSLKLFTDSKEIFSGYLTFLSIYFQFNLNAPLEEGLKKLKLAHFLQKETARKFPYDRKIIYQRAILYGTGAEWKWWHNIFAENDFKKAIELYTEIIKSKVKMGEAYHNRAVNLMFLARGYYHFKGLNPEKFLLKAERDFQNSLKLFPRDYPTYVNRGFLHSLMFDFAFDNGNQCEQFAIAIIENGKEAIKISPLYSYGYQILTKGYLKRAICQKDKKKAYRYLKKGIKTFEIFKKKTGNVDNIVDEYRFSRLFVAYKFDNKKELAEFNNKWLNDYITQKDFEQLYYDFYIKGEIIFMLLTCNDNKDINALEKLVNELKPFSGKKYLSDIALGDCVLYLAHYYKSKKGEKYRKFLTLAKKLIKPYMRNPVTRTVVYSNALNFLSGKVSKKEMKKNISKSPYLSVKYSFFID